MTEHRLSSGNEAPPEAEDGTDPAAPASRPDSIENPEQASVAALESQLRRALADLDNLRKRVDREVARQRAAERAEVTGRWLAVVDNLDRALEHGGADSSAVLEGVRAVRDQALDILAQLGFPRYDDVGGAFDPARHEAVGALPAAPPPGTVVTVIRPGYGTTETILRPAGVIVSKGPVPKGPAAGGSASDDRA